MSLDRNHSAGSRKQPFRATVSPFTCRPRRRRHEHDLDFRHSISLSPLRPFQTHAEAVPVSHLHDVLEFALALSDDVIRQHSIRADDLLDVLKLHFAAHQTPANRPQLLAIVKDLCAEWRIGHEQVLALMADLAQPKSAGVMHIVMPQMPLNAEDSSSSSDATTSHQMASPRSMRLQTAHQSTWWGASEPVKTVREFAVQTAPSLRLRRNPSIGTGTPEAVKHFCSIKVGDSLTMVSSQTNKMAQVITADGGQDLSRYLQRPCVSYPR